MIWHAHLGTSHIIQSGDTLFASAQQVLGDRQSLALEPHAPDGSSFTEDQARNLQVGQEVCIPSGGEPVPAPVPVPGRRH